MATTFEQTGYATGSTSDFTAAAVTAGQGILSAAIDNTTALAPLDDLELLLTFASAPTAGQTIDIYLLPSLDGTNYPDGAATVLPQLSLLVGNFQVRAVSTAQRLSARNIEIPPGKYKYFLQDSSSQPMPASWTFTRKPHGYQNV
jgi:hypothetical protein